MIKIDFDKMGGLAPAIIQDDDSGEVLMLGFMNPEAWEMTLKTGKATFFSRTRNTLWIKGETSGHVQQVREIRVDCDNDTILLKVKQIGGAACHTGHKSCFYRKIDNNELITIGEKIFDPEEVYKK